MLQGKNIVLGITGSIAAYKAAYLVRALRKKGAEVQVVMTPAAREFITPVTLSPLSGRPVVSEFFSANDGVWHSHVDLGLWADAMLVAPATASTIGKMANGIADNMLITTYLSMKAPVFVAPAMDLDMYRHPSTQANLARLKSYGNHLIEPADGFLASGLEGKGRMEEPDKIVSVLEDFFEKGPTGDGLKGKRVLITAGPTYERIDPVRFIGNYSSGKMAFALVEACVARGAEVELVCGPVSLATPAGPVHRTDVESAAQMHEACQKLYPSCQAGILCAAVADFTPETCAGSKLKRKGDLTLTLKPTPDIAASLGEMKQPGQVLAGFALETDHENDNARGKLQRKHFDFIVLNSMRDAGAGFRVDTNKVTIITEKGEQAFPLKSKREVAEDIVGQLVACLEARENA